MQDGENADPVPRWCVHDPLLGCPHSTTGSDRRHFLFRQLLVAVGMLLLLVSVQVLSEKRDVGDAPENHNPAPVAITKLAAKTGPLVRPWVPKGCEPIAALITEHGMPEWMTVVAWRESRCLPEVSNLNPGGGERSYGVMQLNLYGASGREIRARCGIEGPQGLLDAGRNIECAGRLYRAWGYRPWDSGTYFNE